MNQSLLHSNNFDLCRICLCEPEANRDVPFVSIHTPVLNPAQNLRVINLMSELLGINIDCHDDKPKIICEACCSSLVSWFEFKMKSAESEVVINYIATKKFGVTPGVNMSGNSVASTSSRMLTNNDQSYQGTPFKHCQPQSNQSNMFVASTSRTSFASTSSQMLMNNKASTRPSTSSQMLVNNKASTRPSTSSQMLVNNKASTRPSTSSQMLVNNKASTRPSSSQMLVNNKASTRPSTSSQMLVNNKASTRPSTSSQMLVNYKASTQPSTSSQILGNYEASTQPSTSSQTLFNNNTGSTLSSTFNHPQRRSQRLNTKKMNVNGCGSGDSSKSIIANNSNSALTEESDDDCIEIITPIETVDLISSEESDGNDVDSSDYEESVISSDNDETIELSSDSDNGMNFNNETEKLYYCSICQKKNILNHDCSQHSKSFFTCLVPNCNILSRSKKHFISHYKLHIGMSSTSVMCFCCFQETERSNIDGNGCHIRCNTVNAFKCYTCNVTFSSMQKFAFHKLKEHNGLLMNVHGNYLCLHCEQSSPELTVINDHMTNCLENQANNVTAASLKLKKPTGNGTKLLPFKKSNIKNRTVKQNGKYKKSLTSKHVLFTCIKPNCNLVFQTFRIFKLHYRLHCKLGNTLICWQCCMPFSDISGLRNHQKRNNCRTPGMFKCFECPKKFDDLESLSIHKFTFHNANLIACKRNRKTIMCAFCQVDIAIYNFKSHLAICKKNNVNKNTCTKNVKDTYNCLTCGKVFFSSVSLSNHSRIHNRAQIIPNVKKEKST